MKFVVALFLSSISTATASHGSSPTKNPTSAPSAAPSVSTAPSSKPSDAPSDQPSAEPSDRPSGQPSFSPSDQPSSEPSDAPSCTPSQAPTPSPSINLFYPEQTAGYEAGCLNDGAQPGWMEQNPTAWLFSTLDKCCSTHFAWNYAHCMGTLDDQCARALWYPDWEGENKSCKRDGNEPSYMVANPSGYMFSTKADCCEEHYSYAESTCMGGGTASSATGGSGDKWYADWVSGDEVCLNDGQAPDYMVDEPTLWLYDDHDACCERFFNYKKSSCMGGAAAAPTGHYFPDWAGDNEECLLDSASTPAPEYMTANHGRDDHTFLHDTLQECCEKHYSYRVHACMGGTGGAAAAPTGHYFPDWEGDNKGCLVDSTATPAPEYMVERHTATNDPYLFDTLDECCEQYYSYAEEECKGVTASAGATGGTHHWYIDWDHDTCVKDCVVSASDPDCGGLAGTYGQSNLHDDKRTCCNTHMSYDFRACFT